MRREREGEDTDKEKNKFDTAKRKEALFECLSILFLFLFSSVSVEGVYFALIPAAYVDLLILLYSIQLCVDTVVIKQSLILNEFSFSTFHLNTLHSTTDHFWVQAFFFWLARQSYPCYIFALSEL